MAQSTNCHVKRSRDFSSWRMPKLGRLFQAAQCEGRPLTSQLPARERNRTVGLLQLRLHAEAGGKTANAKHVISQHIAVREKRLLGRLYSFVPRRVVGHNSSFWLRHWSGLIHCEQARAWAGARSPNPTHLRIMMRQFVS